MPTPKAPQDHLPKIEKPKVETVDGGRKVTYKGVTVTVTDEALNDFELLDDIRAIDVDENASRLPGVLRRMVGDGYKPVLEALRDKKTGRVTIDAGSEYVKDLLEAVSGNS